MFHTMIRQTVKQLETLKFVHSSHSMFFGVISPAADESSWRCKMATVAPVRPPVEMVKKVPTPLFSSTSFAGDRSHEN